MIKLPLKLQVIISYTSSALADLTLAVTDITTTGQSVAPADAAMGASRLVLRKTVENISEVMANGLAEGALETDSLNEAKPGDLLRYRIYYRNAGTGPITDLKVDDAVPAFTLFVSASQLCETTPTNLACSPQKAGDNLDWVFSGTLEGGEGLC